MPQLQKNADIRNLFKLQNASKVRSVLGAEAENSTSSLPSSASSSQPPIHPTNSPSFTNEQIQLLDIIPPQILIDTAPTSSLSSSPSSPISSLPARTPASRHSIPEAAAGRRSRNDEIKGSSDGSDSGSDGSLIDLSVLLQTSSSESRPRPASTLSTPSTPVGSRRQRDARRFHDSPLAVLPKYHFDIKALANQAVDDKAIEASSKRLKLMLAEKDDMEAGSLQGKGPATSTSSANLSVLGTVVADGEGGDLQKLARALKRTEATSPEKHWSFFGTDHVPERRPFPTASVQSKWKKLFEAPQTRYQTFVSGFAEDLVFLKRYLPDELLLWILDEICVESHAVLRTAYANVLRESRDQFSRLLVPSTLAKVFQSLGGIESSTDTTQKIVPSPMTEMHKAQPFDRWANLRTFIKLLGRGAGSLQQQSRTYIIIILLRMSIDDVVNENIDVFDLVYDTISRLCEYTPSAAWVECVQELCTALFNATSLPTFRLKILLIMPSLNVHSHDLRQRLAMCFYFNSLTYSRSPTHLNFNLKDFRQRLADADFDTGPRTDYREFAALISLLGIAIADARPSSLDLSDPETEDAFNADIEALAAEVKDIMRNIGNPGAAFISRIEAKEVLESVAHRIADTLRTKPRARMSIFDQMEKGKKVEDLEAERRGMEMWMGKDKVSDDAEGD